MTNKLDVNVANLLNEHLALNRSNSVTVQGGRVSKLLDENKAKVGKETTVKDGIDELGATVLRLSARFRGGKVDFAQHAFPPPTDGAAVTYTKPVSTQSSVPSAPVEDGTASPESIAPAPPADAIPATSTVALTNPAATATITSPAAGPDGRGRTRNTGRALGHLIQDNWIH